ncbi:bacillithiol system redox-active protein YtxJ [Xanthocytophaga flava]|uniref:bacillithiol system redox-active protein YtxJ n=1 Tax=Xanthocytophaga flava TaxID=3048013 RepID=UPI0028D24E3E|nr:bacillithiol system redox-active protein YtxJ [Xanthocytophaga flavus]MDJ1471209.1 bacillithiol system redox-active protein YtxJ [Xanthocytophaga flavus]
MNWIQLTEEKQLQEIEQVSHQQPVVIFKHSTRCSISATALGRLERNWNEGEMQAVKAYYLDLISFRTLSTRIAHTFDVEHQSPQLLVIQKGECVYNASHWDIAYADIKKQLESSHI